MPRKKVSVEPVEKIWLPRIFFQNLPRTVRRAVVHKDNLDLAHRLIQNGIRAGAQKPFAVVNRHNQTDHLFFPL